MSPPKPQIGLVIHYSYLWHREHLRGEVEGVKDRPCAVILAIEGDTGPQVAVLGITHSPPPTADAALEIPASAKRRLGLDGARSWIVTTEANVFTWPGPDLRPRNRSTPKSLSYGLLPSEVVFELRRRFREQALSR